MILHGSAGQPYCSAKFLSLRTGDEVHNIPYTEPITDIHANDRYNDADLIITFSVSSVSFITSYIFVIMQYVKL